MNTGAWKIEKLDVVMWCMNRKYVSQQISISPFTRFVFMFTFEVVGILLQATEFNYSLWCHFDIWQWVNVDVPNYTFSYSCIICAPFYMLFCLMRIVYYFDSNSFNFQFDNWGNFFLWIIIIWKAFTKMIGATKFTVVTPYWKYEKVSKARKKQIMTNMI